jgi:4-hydroxy-tetrahydrodipicolinate synthase
MTTSFAGLSVALATPFTPDYKLDMPAYRRLVRHAVKGGVDVLMTLPTTGEAPVINDAERDELIKATLEEAQGRKVVVGAGCNETRQAVLYSERAQELGADGVLIVTPYYNKPTQDGLVAHYREIARAHPGFPLVAYNVPGRTGVDLMPDAIQKLCEIKEVVGVKEATANMIRMVDIVEKCGAERLALLSGDDFTIAPFIALGGKGVISVSANVAPRLVSDLVHAALEGDVKKAAELQVKLNPLHRALFLESNPIPVKAALHLLGKYGPEVRLPLTPMSEGPKARLVEAMKGLGLL